MKNKILPAITSISRHWLALTVTAGLILSGSYATPATAQGPNGYVWKNVAVSGANAMLTDVYPNPAQNGLVYLKTDVGGVYKWDNVNSKWLPLTDFISFDQRNYFGAEAFAFDPSNINTLYYAGGSYTNANGTIFKSLDQGATWTKLNIDVPMGGNEDRRWGGPRMQVSNNGTVVLFGSRTQGLWRSANSGSTWAQISTAVIPLSGDDYGVEAVVFDRATANVAYCAVSGHGVYKSTDNGATWNFIGGNGGPRRLTVAPNGDLWYTHGSGVSRYSGGAWTDFFPGGSSEVYCAVAVNPANSSEITTATHEVFQDRLYRTTDGGSNWSLISRTFHPIPTWWHVDTNWSIANLAYDPFNTSQVYGDNWRTPNIAQLPNVDFTTLAAGHEEDVILCTRTFPSGTELFAGIADVDGFKFNNGLDTYPTQQLGIVGDWAGYTLCIDAQATNTNNMFRTSTKEFYRWSNLSKSTDNGTTWNNVSLPTNPNLFPQWCALSATDANNIVLICNGNYNTDSSGGSWSPAPATNPWLYSTNGGTNWNVISGLPTPATPFAIWSSDDYLRADPILGGTFYFLDVNTGTVYKSTNGGANFTAQGTPSVTNYGSKQEHHLHVNPYTSGDIWLSFDNDGWTPGAARDAGEGLYHSTNSGVTWTKISAVSRAWNFCVGKRPAVGQPPAVYIYGRLNGDTSDWIYRSLDNGVSWLNIMDPAQRMSCIPFIMEGSLQVYGQIYVGTSGRGLFYGTPASGIPAPPTGLSATGQNTQVLLSWTASPGATTYNLKRSTVSGSGYAAVVSQAGTTYTNTGLTNGTTYYFVVTATNSFGTSGNSNQASAAPWVAVQAQIASGTAVIDGTAEAAWNGATAYPLTKTMGTITSGADCSATWKGMWDATNLYILASVTDDVKTNDSTNPWDDDSVEIYLDADHNGGTAYDANDRQIVCGWGDAAAVEGGGRSITGVTFGKTDPTGTTYIIEAKIPWAVEAFTAVANAIIGVDIHVNDDDDGGVKEGKVIWTDGTDQAWTNPSLFGTGKLLAGGAPAPPTGLTATPGNTQVVLNWTASSGATTYSVLRSTVSGSGYASVATGIVPVTYTNTGLTNGTTYYFVVTATNASGTSGNSNQASATPIAPPAAPTGLTAVAGIAQALLSWTASATATTYNVKRSTVSGSGYATVSSPATTYFMNTGLTNGTTYYYVVSAVNAGGESANTGQVSALPSATVPQAQIAFGTATIDGTVEAAWNNAAKYLLSKSTGTISSYTDCSATWQGMWDATNLYILVNVNDDVKTNDSVNAWDDDAAEVYLDADHNGGTGYDANDRQIVFGWGDAAAVEGGGRAISGVTFAKADPTSTSYRIEAKIPWAVEAFTPAANAIIGIDVMVDDDDDGGVRDGHDIWNDGTDGAWGNPSLFGAGKLLPGAGSLTGAVSGVSTTVNMTTEGTSDWAHWFGYDHKTSGGSKISNYTVVGTGSVLTYTNDPRTLTWTDGTPTASGSSTNGNYVAGINNGFSITAPADTTQRTLRVYIGGWQSGGTLVAHLSDSSASDYTDTSLSNAGASYDGFYTLTYKAASASQTITVTWKQASGTGNVTLSGATLQ